MSKVFFERWVIVETVLLDEQTSKRNTAGDVDTRELSDRTFIPTLTYMLTHDSIKVVFLVVQEEQVCEQLHCAVQGNTLDTREEHRRAVQPDKLFPRSLTFG